MRRPWLAALLLVLASCTRETGRQHTVGPLRCVQLEKRATLTMTGLVWRVTVDGKPLAGHEWSGACIPSPSPSVQALALGHHVLSLRSGKPVVNPLSRNPDLSLWACDGRCIVSHDRIHLVETGEERPIPDIPVTLSADGKSTVGGAPLAVAPDMKTVVSLGRASATQRSFCVRDVEASTAVEWRVPLDWVSDCKYDLDCKQRQQALFRWRHGPSRHELIPPEAPGAQRLPATWLDCGRRL